MTLKSSATPRTRNAEATRAAILEAARQHFLSDGYDNAGVRSIAGSAGVDAALICRYFGSKKALFAEVLENSSEDPMDIIAGDVETCGRRLAEALASSPGKSNKQAFIGLVTRSCVSEEASLLVRHHIEKHFVKPFARWLGGKGATEKGWLLASTMIGVLTMGPIRPAGSFRMEGLAPVLQSIIDRTV